VSVTAKVLWKHWNKFAPVNGISVAGMIYSNRAIHLRRKLCPFSYNQLVTSYGCLCKIAHLKHKVLCYIIIYITRYIVIHITWQRL